MALKFKNYIAILNSSNATFKFVTGFGEKHSVMMWEYNKPAMEFSLTSAKDYIIGLALNGYPAVVMQIPDFYEKIGNYDPSIYPAEMTEERGAEQ